LILVKLVILIAIHEWKTNKRMNVLQEGNFTAEIAENAEI